MEQHQNSQSGEERVDLQEILNPKSKISSISTFAHIFWLRRWFILGVWLVLGVPAALFLAFFDIPRTYWATSYLRFPNVVGAEDNMVHDMALGNSSSIFTLIKSYNVMSRTIHNKKLQFQVRTKDVFRRNVFEDIQYEDNAPYGHYIFLFQSNRNLEITYLPPGSKNKKVVFRNMVPENGVVSIPSMTLRINRKLLSIGGSAKVEADFIPSQYAFMLLKAKLSVGSLDKEESQAKVNYAVTLEGDDPYMVADVLNDLLQNFIVVYSGTSEGQDVSVITQMEKDLENARRREQEARDALARFYSGHPVLLETQQTDSYALVNAQSDKTQLEDRLENLQQLQNRKPPADANNRRKKTWISDAAFLLNSYGVLQANSIQSRLQETEAKRTELSTKLPPSHPRIAALDAEIASLQPELDQILIAVQRGWAQKLEQARAMVAEHLPKNMPIAADLEAKRLTTEKEGAAKAVEDLQTAYNKAKLGMGRNVFKVNIVDEARTPSYQPPSWKRRLAFSLAAFVLTLFPGFVWVVLLQIFFGRVYTRDDADRKLGLKVLGEVFFQEPMQPNDWKDPLDSSILPHVENFRLVRSEIENYFSNSSKLAFLITSAKPGEGKSLFAANIAVSFARHGSRTLLVDADLRHGNLTHVFGARRDTGLTDLLREPAQDRETQKNRILSAVVPAKEKNLFFLPRGGHELRPGEPINQNRMEEFLSMIRGEFDALVVDTSPVLPVADALNLMKVVSNVVFLVRSGEISSLDANETLERIKARGVRVGCVLNAIEETPFVKNHFTAYQEYYTSDSVDAAPAAPAPPTPVSEEKRPVSYLSQSAVESLIR